MKKYTVGVVGATGMVGQRFVTLLENHPWFQLTVVAASARSAGKSYEEAVGPRWAMTTPIPEEAKSLVVLDALADRETIASSVDFIFCAVDMKKEEIRALEESYAKLECPVISNNSAHRWTPDVPMVIPASPGNPGPKIPAGNPARFHCGEVQLFHSILRPRAASPAPLRHNTGAGLYLSSHFWGRKNLYNLA